MLYMATGRMSNAGTHHGYSLTPARVPGRSEKYALNGFSPCREIGFAVRRYDQRPVPVAQQARFERGVFVPCRKSQQTGRAPAILRPMQRRAERRTTLAAQYGDPPRPFSLV